MRVLMYRLLRDGGVALCLGASSLSAQQSPLRPAEIGQITNEVLRALMPPEQQVSRVEVTKRGIFFDHVRTLEAFGHRSDAAAVPFSALGVRSGIRAGSREMLSDCRQFENLPCQRLGWSVYAYVAPVTLTDSTAVVLASFMWPNRGFVAFREGITPSRPAQLVGFAAEVHLARGADGKWTYVGKGVFKTGD